MKQERWLATVLFTDIVGSTERAAELGDRRWRALLQAHHDLARREIARHGGRELTMTGDGFLATFDAPERAIRCACAIRDAVRRLGIEIRGGVHTGEVEVMGKNLGGLAVHIGARVAAASAPGEILVSSTVRDLAAGSGFEFEDRGPHALKGVPGEWRLSAVTGEPLRMAVPDLWTRAREARLPRVVLIYLAACTAILWLTFALRDRLALPTWVLPLAVLLLAIGLVVLTATAWVQSRPVTAALARADELPGSWEVDLGGIREAVSRGRLPHLTWARSILGGVAAFVVLFLVSGLYVLIRERGSVPEEEAGRKMVAVLPFENLGPVESQYFADGITDEITARLAGIRGLGVISRTSVNQYRKTSKTIKQIGSELGADYVLEGSVRWDESPEGSKRVRVTPQLIRVSDDSHLWANVYDENLSDVFQIQSDIASQVTKALDIRLLEPERRSLEAKPTENLEAYDYYLRGNDYFNRSYDRDDIEHAADLYEKAIGLDPQFALAYARLARAHSLLFWFFYDRTEDRLRRAKAAADRALELAPELPEAHVALGDFFYRASLDYDRALEEFAIAQKSQAENSELLDVIAIVQRRQAKFKEALANWEKATRLDPRNAQCAYDFGETLFYARRYDEAKRPLERVLAISPDWSAPYLFMYSLYQNRGEAPARLLEVLRRGVREVGTSRMLSRFLTQTPWFRAPSRSILAALDQEYSNEMGSLTPETFEGDSLGYYVFRAEWAGIKRDRATERVYLDSLRSLVEPRVQARPQEAPYHSLLGFAYAGLGRKEEAIREGKKALELRPYAKDAIMGPVLANVMAQIYLMTGEHDAAVEQLEFLLSVPSGMSAQGLRTELTWEPLRNNARFQALLAKVDSPASPASQPTGN
jgi:serine/threonine-protein kinase